MHPKFLSFLSVLLREEITLREFIPGIIWEEEEPVYKLVQCISLRACVLYS